MKLGTDLN